jgi:hypothetical protein
MPKIDSILTCSADYCPSREWENEIVEDFSELRMVSDIYVMVMHIHMNVTTTIIIGQYAIVI